MVVDHHVIELYHYQAQKYQTGKKSEIILPVCRLC